MAFSAFSTRATQWGQVMPSTRIVLRTRAFSSASSAAAERTIGSRAVSVTSRTTGRAEDGASGAAMEGLKSFRRSALVTTLTELKLIAAAANIGLSLRPKGMNSTPAASGMPMEL